MTALTSDTNLIPFAIEVAGAVIGAVSAYVMSRRYTSSFLLNLFYALIAPLFFLVGRGDQVRGYYASSVAANRDVPVSAGQMALGLNLLFWAFFLQLLRAFL